jgi:hypothetical protein
MIWLPLYSSLSPSHRTTGAVSVRGVGWGRGRASVLVMTASRYRVCSTIQTEMPSHTAAVPLVSHNESNEHKVGHNLGCYTTPIDFKKKRSNDEQRRTYNMYRTHGRARILKYITDVRVLNETDTLRKTGKTLIWGSRRPLHGVANVKSSVANDETGFKDLTLKHLLECSKINRRPIAKRETKFKEYKEIRTGGSYRVRTPRISSRLDWVK